MVKIDAKIPTWEWQIRYYKMFPWLHTRHLIKEKLSDKEAWNKEFQIWVKFRKVLNYFEPLKLTNRCKEGNNCNNIWKLAGRICNNRGLITNIILDYDYINMMTLTITLYLIAYAYMLIFTCCSLLFLKKFRWINLSSIKRMDVSFFDIRGEF